MRCEDVCDRSDLGLCIFPSQLASKLGRVEHADVTRALLINCSPPSVLQHVHMHVHRPCCTALMHASRASQTKTHTPALQIARKLRKVEVAEGDRSARASWNRLRNFATRGVR